MTDPPSRPSPDEARSPCPHCGTPVLVGARKCRGCRRWLEPPPRRSGARFARSATLVTAATLAVLAALATGRQSPVGEAPPLTPIATGSSVAEAEMSAEQPPSGVPAETLQPQPLGSAEPEPLGWHARQVKVDVHPLDLAFSAAGRSIYVSADDASLREYDVATGRLLHMASIPAQGDRIRLLAGRYLAVIRLVDAAHIPVLDTQNWERDPVLLPVGGHPADVVALPDRNSVVTASSQGKRLSWFRLDTGRLQGDLRLPHAIRQLFVVTAGGRTYVGAMGQLYRADKPEGAFIELFDPTEEPFGATRRSVSTGRDPREGAVTRDGAAIFFADYLSNTASLLRVDGSTPILSAGVGNGPVAAFLLDADRYGVTLDAEARTATVIETRTMKRTGTLMLPAPPLHGATSADGSVLFVSLGGTTWPPSGSGAIVIGAAPPRIVAELETGRGAARVAASPVGDRAAVANYLGKALTIIER